MTDTRPDAVRPAATSDRPRVTVIAARARNGVIGAANGMPWHLPEELKHFKATTMGQVLVMGRKTFDSIGRPLPGRQTIVVTRNLDWQHAGCLRADSLVGALTCAAALGCAETFIVGGAQIYEQSLALADRLLITEIDLCPDGDAWFPAIDAQRWRVTGQQPMQSANGTRFVITEYLLRQS